MYKNIAIVLLLIICFGLYAEGVQQAQQNARLQYTIKVIAAFNQEYFSKHNLDWNDYLASVEQRIADEKASKGGSVLEWYFDSCKSSSLPPLSKATTKQPTNSAARTAPRGNTRKSSGNAPLVGCERVSPHTDFTD